MNRLKVNRVKIEGAISELRSTRSEVRHLIKEALSGEIESIKETALEQVGAMFEGLENYLNVLMNADLVRNDV